MKIPDEVKKLARLGKGKKDPCHAIHALRRTTRLGLAEAKEMVEIIAAGGDVELPPDPPPACRREPEAAIPAAT